MKRLAPLLPPLALSILILLGLPTPGRAANCTTTVNESSSQNWSSAVWQTNGTGTAAAPVAGNTYEMVGNGVAWAGPGVTAVRTPNSSGTKTFPGNSLQVDANTVLVLKDGSTSGSTLNFPGVNGNPGLILNGGMMEMGNTGNWPITGLINVAAQSYFNAGANTLTPSVTQSITISGQLSGSGTFVIYGGYVNIPQQISCNTNTFNGQWVVKAGWLKGVGTNSLGTNSITIDPHFVMPDTNTADGYFEVPGPAWLEVGYNINSAGTLILTNGGQFTNHQNCCFTAVIVEGTALTSGTHYYNDLVSQFPANFPAGGNGTITVQPYGTPPVLAPAITTQPVPLTLYAGRTAVFNVAALGYAPLTYQWQKGGVNLTNVVGHISGATTSTLTISSITATDAANYNVVVTGGSLSGSTNSSVVSLTVWSPSEPYATAVLAANPVAFYEFNDSSIPETNGPAFDYAGGFNGIYGNGVLNGPYGVTGPTSASGFPGFADTNTAAEFFTEVAGSEVTVPPWNLNTNTVTITAWVNPAGAEANSLALVMCRGNGLAAGLGYSVPQDPATGNYTLGYTWNGVSWDSGLYAPPNQWSFVALVVTPTNGIIYVMNTNGLLWATNVSSHVVQTFNATTVIGDDPADGGDGAQTFNGTIDDVAVFNSALSQSQLLALFSTADGGVVNFPPLIGVSPASLVLGANVTAQFDVVAGGSGTLSYQWQAGPTGLGVFTNLSDAGNISGSATVLLTITNTTLANAADYRVVVTNAYGSATSSVATLTVIVGQNFTTTVTEPLGWNWNSAIWYLNGDYSSTPLVPIAGNTYECVPNGIAWSGASAVTAVRSPAYSGLQTFPGDSLMLDTNTELVLKQSGSNPNFPGVNGNPGLILNGGMITMGNLGNWPITGTINVAAQSYLNAGANTVAPSVTQSVDFQGQLSGSGAFVIFGGYTNVAQRISGTTNTFSGQWIVKAGWLLGAGANSLGTNSITIDPGFVLPDPPLDTSPADGYVEIAGPALLEVDYNLNSAGTLTLTNGGQFTNHQDCCFAAVIVEGTALTPGTHYYSDLAAQFPANFPAGGTGSITVQPYSSALPPVSLQVQRFGTNLQLNWSQGLLLQATNVTGPWTTNISATSPFTVSPTAPQMYYRVRVE